MAGQVRGDVLTSSAVDELRATFRGEVVEAGNARYDELRQVFNRMFDCRPRLILRPEGAADVIRGIGMARTSGLPLAIRGGGHSVAGFSSVEDGIVLDLRAMRGIRVDPERRTVRVQPGLNWGELDRETQSFGLAVTGGRVTTTGVVGFTLGTGSGWLERKFGFAADNLTRADVVTADGDVVTAAEDENEDLLWGLKGGGGNFGVVTEVEFALRPLPPIVYGGLAAFAPEKSAEVIRVWRDLSHTSDELGWAVASVTAPPEPFVPQEWQGRRVIGVAGLITGAQDEAEKALAPLRALGPVVDLWQPMPYTVVQGLIDDANPYGRRNYWRAHNLTDFDESVVDVFIEAAATCPSPFTAIILMNGGGAISRVSEAGTAISGRNAPFNMHLDGMWEDSDADDANISWVKDVSSGLGRKIAEGISLNFQTEVSDDQLTESWGTAKLDRLRALKDRYDPDNVFRLNQNIKPSRGS
jgi:FAD/FMN-containing dehydrogenase